MHAHKAREPVGLNKLEANVDVPWAYTPFKRSPIISNLKENEPTSYLIYVLSQQFPNECMVS